MTDLASFLEEEIAAGSFPGGAALIGSSDSILAAASAGRAAVVPGPSPLGPETLFDLASLTKPLAGGALAHAAVEAGLDLASPPGRFFPAWKKTRFDGITLESLLTHTAGLVVGDRLELDGDLRVDLLEGGFLQSLKTVSTMSVEVGEPR